MIKRQLYGSLLVCISILSFLTVLTSCKDVRKTYFPDGKVETEINYVKGVPSGLSKIYYPSGNLDTEGIMDGSGLQGLCTKYYEEGCLRAYVQMKNNKVNGIAKEYYKNGKLFKFTETVMDSIVYMEQYDSIRGNLIGKLRKLKLTDNGDTLKVGDVYSAKLTLTGEFKNNMRIKQFVVSPIGYVTNPKEKIINNNSYEFNVALFKEGECRITYYVIEDDYRNGQHNEFMW